MKSIKATALVLAKRAIDRGCTTPEEILHAVCGFNADQVNRALLSLRQQGKVAFRDGRYEPPFSAMARSLNSQVWNGAMVL